MQANMHVEACILDANSHQGLGDISFVHFARRAPSAMKITKIYPLMFLARPGGMRRAGGGKGGRRLLDLIVLNACIGSMRRN